MIKNNRSKTFKAASRLDTRRKWIISGTPIQNNLKELWSLLNWLNEPEYGGKYRGTLLESGTLIAMMISIR